MIIMHIPSESFILQIYPSCSRDIWFLLANCLVMHIPFESFIVHSLKSVAKRWYLKRKFIVLLKLFSHICWCILYILMAESGFQFKGGAKLKDNIIKK